MCIGDKKIYRITLNSGDSLTLFNEAEYMIKLPYKVKRGQLYLESLSIMGAGTLLSHVSLIKISSPSFQQRGCYDSSGRIRNILDEIPTLAYTLNDYDDFFYKNNITVDSVGFPIRNFDLDNKIIEIKLLNQDNNLLDNDQLVGYTMTFVIVDHEPETLEY